MTKFIDATIAFQPKKEVKKTVFTHHIDGDGTMERSSAVPENYDNIMYLGKHRDNSTMDLFKVFDDKNQFCMIYIGTKGDEDYQPL